MELNDYCEQHTTQLDTVLRELERETHLVTTQPHMLSGTLQGQFLQFISKMLVPKAVLEIGTFTGYSALCLASGLGEQGRLHTIDIDEEKEDLIQKYIQKANFQDKVTLHIGNALSIIETLTETFDLVFIDADKENYASYYDLVLPKMRRGGVLIADNVLWKGKVLNAPFDKKTTILDNFNKKIQADPRVENVLLPIRDGMMMIRVI
jgi:caffeoyl-CoA O-methyltransferase